MTSLRIAILGFLRRMSHHHSPKIVLYFSEIARLSRDRNVQDDQKSGILADSDGESYQIQKIQIKSDEISLSDVIIGVTPWVFRIWGGL